MKKKKKKKESNFASTTIARITHIMLFQHFLQKKPQILLKTSLFFQTKHIDHHYSKELKYQELFPIATLQTYIMYIQKNIARKAQKISQNLNSPRKFNNSGEYMN
jgi:hypothetical protein